MCSQSIHAASRMLTLRRKDRRSAEGGSGAWLLCRTLSAILDRGGSDFDIALEVLGERLVGDGHSLANVLIGPLFPRGVDEDRVLTARDRLAMVVFAVPDDGILAGRAGRSRDR